MDFIRVEGITKAYSGVTVLEDASLELRAGELTGLVGENGAGKSTLIKILSGLVPADRGRILVAGEQVSGWSQSAARAAGLSVIHQELLLVPDLTVAENIMLGEPLLRQGALGRIAGVRDDRENERHARELLAELGLDRIDVRRRVRGISPSQAQMVLIARALRRDAKALILDEPTAALAAEDREELFALLRRLLERRTALLLVSHHLHEVEQLADQVTVLRNGRVVAKLGGGDISVPAMVQAMLERDLGEQFPPVRHKPGADVVLDARISCAPAHEPIEISVRSGEILGVTGLLGAGKTEFARALAGLDPAEGVISVAGRRHRPGNPRVSIQKGIALVPEERKAQAVFPDLSVYRNGVVSVATTGSRRLGNRSWLPHSQAVRRLFADVVRKVGVKFSSLSQPAARLSGGNQQKLVIARALAGEPKVLILDEPTRGVDVGSRREIYRVILEQAEAGLGVVLISSDVREAVSMAHRLVIFQHGRISRTIDRPRDKSHDELAALLSAGPGDDLDIDEALMGS